MFDLFKQSLAPAILAAVITYLATPRIIKVAKKLGIIDDPKRNKHEKVIHTTPTPRGGGIAIFLGISISCLVFLPLDQHLKGILLGACVLLLMGFLDDKYNLNPYLRLAIGFIAAALPITFGVGISFVTNPFGGIIDLSNPQLTFHLLGEVRSLWIFADLAALLWIVFVMNMLNMGAKGIDGQLTGVTIIASITIALLSLKFSADITQWPIIILASIVAGSFVGFLPWHIFPQKIMPGYSGATLAGYFLAILSILSTSKVGTLVVVLGIPLLDTGYVVVRRILAGKSPVWGDRSHLHHKLLDSGWSKFQVSLFYWITTALLGILAINLNGLPKLYTIVGVGIALAGTFLWLVYRDKNNQ